MKALTHGRFREEGGPWDEGQKEGERKAPFSALGKSMHTS